MLERLICLVVGYVFGLFQTGFIYGKLKHIDIREYGSGNAGTTNAMRVLGKKAGFITYFGDALKAVAAGLILRFVFHDSNMLFVLLLYTGLGVILGHNFPFYMNFKGGKGIAASSGAILALGDWKLTILAAATFFIVLFVSKYVSVASLCCLTGFFMEVVIFSLLHLIPGISGGQMLEACVIAGIWMVLAYVRHKENIKRLIAGNERKIGQKKEERLG